MAILLAYGLPAMGKTTFLHDYLSAHPQHRFFVMDRAAEWGADAGHWRGRPPPLLKVYEGREELPKADAWPEAGVFCFRGREATEVAQLTLDVGNATFVDDELDFSGGKSGWLENPLRVITHQGRHAENAQGEFTQVNILGACRRPQSLHTDLTDIASQVLIFRVQGARTLERLKNDSHMVEEEWDRIRTLPQWHFKHWPSGTWRQVRSLGEGQKDGRGPKRVAEAPPSGGEGRE